MANYVLVNLFLWALYFAITPEMVPWPLAVSVIWGLMLVSIWYEITHGAEAHRDSVKKEYQRLLKRRGED